MNKIFTIILAVFIFTAAFSQNEDVDAVFNKITKTYTLNSDGTMSYQYFKELKLLSFLSFNRLYGETFIVYNPNFQDLKINEAYTLKADSTRVETPENAFNEVLPRGAAHSATFNNLREMVVTHTATELGATIFLDYTLTTKKGFLPALMGNEIIEESSPVNEMEIIVKVPSDVELQHKMFNLRTAPEIMVMGSEKIYTWKFSGIKASPKESFRDDLPGTPRLVFSTESKTGVVMDWVTRQKAFDYFLDDEMKEFATTTKTEQVDEMKTLLAIQDEVVNNMVYDHVPAEWVGYKARTPLEVWESNGGNQMEKAILLAALLNEASFNAVPVMVAPAKFFDKNVGCLPLFDEVVVKTNTKNYGTIYLSATAINSQSLEFGYNDNVIIPLYKDADLSVTETQASKNEISINGDFTITGDLKITAHFEGELYGQANPFLLLQEDSQNLKSQFTGGMKPKSEEALVIVNTNPAKTEIKMDLEKEKALEDYLGFYIWQMPAIKTGFNSWHISYLSSERLDDFVCPFPLIEKYEFEVEIPAGFEFVNEKQSVSLKNKSGSVKIEISPKNNTLTIKRELALETRVIPVAEYGSFRELINEWLDENMKTVVFRKAVD